MTQEEKDLLLKDLCARLPYGVKIEHNSGLICTLNNLTTYRLYDGDNIKDIYGAIDIFGDGNCVRVEYFRPYLFPLSSMTEEQYYEMQTISGKDCLGHMEVQKSLRECTDFTHWPLYEYRVIDWFNQNHFDYRGLIPLGLAKDATGLNIY